MARRKNLPKLPHGMGSFQWANDEKTNIRFQRTYICSSSGTKHRLTVYGRTTDECFAKMDKKINELEDREAKAFQTSILNPEVKLTDALFDWLENEKRGRNKDRSCDREECTIKNQISPYELGDTMALKVTGEQIQGHLQFLQHEKNYSHSTMKKTYDVLDQFFRFIYQKSPGQNPMIGVPRPQQTKEVGEITLDTAKIKMMKDIVLSDSELCTFKEWCYKEPLAGRRGGTKYGVALYFIALTFLRIGEATSLTWGDIDFKNKKLTVNKAFSRVKDRSEGATTRTKVILTRPKTTTSIREVMLTDEAIEALRHIQERSNFTGADNFVICTEKGTKVLEQNLSTGLKGILKASGLNKEGERDKFGLHYLRHTGISFYLRHGVPIDTISKMAGHANISITQNTYYHVIEEQKRKALEQMNSIRIA